MPFDTENCVEYNANYLRGYTSEKRDVNIDQIRNTVHTQANDIARIAANQTLSDYDRGVAWEDDNFTERVNHGRLPTYQYGSIATCRLREVRNFSTM